MRKVRDVMSPVVLTVAIDDVVGDVRDTILDCGVHFVPVVDSGGKPVGVVSTFDLVEEYAPGEGIVNAMSDRVTMIGVDESLPEAAARMREAYIHHLVVVDDEQMVGVLSTFDLLGELAETT
jgi:CBS domain-containing protein